MRLAKSLWPRTGGGSANRGQVDVPGPDRGEIAWRWRFDPGAATERAQNARTSDEAARGVFDFSPPDLCDPAWKPHGIALSDDGTLRRLGRTTLLRRERRDPMEHR